LVLSELLVATSVLRFLKVMNNEEKTILGNKESKEKINKINLLTEGCCQSKSNGCGSEVSEPCGQCCCGTKEEGSAVSNGNRSSRKHTYGRT
jgi:hypothetical protein